LEYFGGICFDARHPSGVGSNAELRAAAATDIFNQVDVFLTRRFRRSIPARPQRTAGPAHHRNVGGPPPLYGHAQLDCCDNADRLSGNHGSGGRTPQGLPVGIQIMGPFWEDATSITFADLLSREVGGFIAPPGYEQ
jgi:Asp-tRNA(Asn)/Glu-tRNA(Gln) amidotransferase A subunit family amidase